ncbi:MAG: DUF885 domain-containing protein, partial [Planctomycetes bacterium]|nr:DUF885 domain-containing protein [Planctomycetota bacterium]
AALAAWLEHARLRLERVRELDREALSPAGRTNADLLAYELEERLRTAKFHPEQTPVNQLGGPQRDLPQLPSDLVFTTPKQVDDYLARLEAIPAHLAAVTANMRAGLAAKRTPPRVVMGPAADQALAHATEQQEKDPTLHALWPTVADEAQQDRARRALREGVIPAFRAFGEFLRDEYIPGCRESIAARDGIDGIAGYEERLRHHTTLDLGAEEIHRLGLAEVARIRAEMLTVIARSDAPRKEFADFVHYLRTDPRFYHESAAALLAGYRDIAKRIDAHMPALFGRLPRLPYGVKEMPPFIAPASPTAYYYRGSIEMARPGWFIANTFRLDQRPKYEMIPLTLHEAVPGHHLQIALAQEMEDQPEWRTTLSYTAFVEGWALYAERLGLEMEGLIVDPYDDFGRLSYEMWRAMRLVVDTGLHASGWSRERAIAYMLDNSALSRQNVEREVDRYIAWPGQATAYKIGELRIRALRAKAEAALGDRFDKRAFHDMILAEGAIPLPLLEARAAAWLALHQGK